MFKHISEVLDGMNYGKEVIIDLHGCDVTLFNRKDIERFFIELCDLIDMERCDLHFWDDVGVPESEKQTDPKTTGTSAIQFIITSNITLHSLDLLGTVYINVFSCKEFDELDTVNFCRDFFKGTLINYGAIERV